MKQYMILMWGILHSLYYQPIIDTHIQPYTICCYIEINEHDIDVLIAHTQNT